MLLNFTELCKKYNIRLKGVIHVGAHLGQEYDDYKKNGADKILFIEPTEDTFNKLFDRFEDIDDVMCLNYACSDYFGTGMLYKDTTNKGMSNSLLKPDRHLDIHKDVIFDGVESVKVATLDSLLERYWGYPACDDGWTPYNFNLLSMDVQGVEGRVIKGASQTLKFIDYVYSEINFGSTYVNNTLSEELDGLLSDFERVETSAKVGGLWGDCLYIRKSLLS